MNAKKKQELGQYRTPERIASFMASLFEVYPTEVRLLDAGAGDGTLTAAFVKRFCDSRHRSKRLAMLGLEVSTGRVVDFRAKEFLVREAHEGTVPLIYPCHFKGSFVHWPNPGGRKPNAIRDTERTQELLVPGAIYVLVKRFTSKEERRRVVACIYDAHRIHAERVGFENHLNYFHARGRGLPTSLAKGLAAFLNSTLVDVYFRQFNGHTQVNATDLRNVRYPTRAELESLGRKICGALPNQTELDALVERELL